MCHVKGKCGYNFQGNVSKMLQRFDIKKEDSRLSSEQMYNSFFHDKVYHRHVLKTIFIIFLRREGFV